MILILSGEGPTDLGSCRIPAEMCENNEQDNYLEGPLVTIINNIFQEVLFYSIKDCPESIIYIPEGSLTRRAKEQSGKKRLGLRSAIKGAETRYFFNNAKMLGQIAKEIEFDKKCPSIAILFRDADGTHRTPPNDWQLKFDSIINGFIEAGYPTGVPMLPKPKSEAWLLAACKENPYENCGELENLSGNDGAPYPVKQIIKECLGKDPSTENLRTWLEEHGYNHQVVASQMPSFSEFYRVFVDKLGIHMRSPKSSIQ